MTTKNELSKEWMAAERDFDDARGAAVEAKNVYLRLAEEARRLKDMARAAYERWQQSEK